VTGLIDEVAIWKALTEAEITQLKDEGLASLFPPEANGLVAHWPMEEALGDKTPDLVSGYDMTLNNLTAADLVAGKVGKCFSFANARQTLLSRVHGANDSSQPTNMPPLRWPFGRMPRAAAKRICASFPKLLPRITTIRSSTSARTARGTGQIDLYIRQQAGPMSIISRRSPSRSMAPGIMSRLFNKKMARARSISMA
jgi:hypothetical protein